MRKFTFLSIALFIAILSANAQISKGSTFLGGSLSVFSDKSESTTSSVENQTTNWSIRPQFGRAFAENKIAGLFLNFGRSEQKQTSSPSNSAQNENSFYGGGVFFRNYYPLSKRFFLFGDAGLGINFGKQKNNFDNGVTNFTSHKSKSTEGNLSLTPGISFAATKKLHLEAALNNLLSFSYQSSEVNEYSSPNTLFRTTDRKTFSANVNSNAFSTIAVGLRWILPSKK